MKTRRGPTYAIAIPNGMGLRDIINQIDDWNMPKVTIEKIKTLINEYMTPTTYCKVHDDTTTATHLPPGNTICTDTYCTCKTDDEERLDDDREYALQFEAPARAHKDNIVKVKAKMTTAMKGMKHHRRKSFGRELKKILN